MRKCGELFTEEYLQREMSEPDPRLLERLFPGPNNKIEIQHRRNVSAAAGGAPTGGSNKVRIAEMCLLISQALDWITDLDN